MIKTFELFSSFVKSVSQKKASRNSLYQPLSRAKIPTPTSMEDMIGILNSRKLLANKITGESMKDCLSLCQVVARSSNFVPDNSFEKD
jgi:hypothetical protein